METEADAVGRMIDQAIADQIDFDIVDKTIKILSFLRTTEATKHCLKLVQDWRKYPVMNVFDGETQEITVELRILTLARRHQSLEKGGAQLNVIRRLNSVRLDEEIRRLDPVLKKAKVSSPSHLTDSEHNEKTDGHHDRPAVGTHFRPCQNLGFYSRTFRIRISDLSPYR